MELSFATEGTALHFSVRARLPCVLYVYLPALAERVAVEGTSHVLDNTVIYILDHVGVAQGLVCARNSNRHLPIVILSELTSSREAKQSGSLGLSTSRSRLDRSVRS